jgi:hypothetical protein
MASVWKFGNVNSINKLDLDESERDSVILEDNQEIFLKPKKLRRFFREFLDVSMTHKEPVAVRVSLKNRNVKEVCFPYETPVLSIAESTKSQGDCLVNLLYSPSPHFLSRQNSNYEEIKSVLEQAKKNQSSVLVATSPQNKEILMARLATPVPLIRVEPTGFNPTESQFDSVSVSFADFLFEKIRRGKRCDRMPIPFRYVEEGCVSRAHEMSRLIREEGVEPVKVWIFDTAYQLHPKTLNHPQCKVRWSYHVAPAVRTNDGLRIIDPSLFESSVSLRTWRDWHNSCSAKLLFTCPHVYIVTENLSVIGADPDYSRTQSALRQLNLNFLGWVAIHGKPPFKKCWKRCDI